MVSVDGLVSGLDTSGLIQQLLDIERRPIRLAQQQIQIATQRQTAFLDLTARLLSLQADAGKLADTSVFERVSASSSDESALAVSASAGVPPGNYSFRVGQLASPSQFTSSGFATADDTAIGAGSLSIEFGGFVDGETDLDALNGGLGVSRGSVRITDRSGSSAIVDLSSAVTVDDVIQTINDTPGIDVTARIASTGDTNVGRGFVLEDTSGGTGNFRVEEVSGGRTASELGLAANVAAATIQGNVVRSVGRETSLQTLNDGLGLSSDGGLSFDVGGTVYTVSPNELEDARTLGDVIDLIETNSSGAIAATVGADGQSLTLTAASAITVTSTGNATSDLGLLGAAAGTTVSGARLIAGLNDISLARLNGGSGVAAGSIEITDRSGTATVVDLSSAETLQDVIRLINASGAGVEADIDSNGNALLIRDTTGGTSDLQIAESGSTTAAELGILGVVASNELEGTDLDPQYIAESTLLSSLNGGSGVASGELRITATDGTTFTVSLAQNERTLGDVISDIEGAAGAAGIGANFSVGINASGNGLLITDTSGAGTLRIDEVGGGTTAADLGIAGAADNATPGIIDGALEKNLTISDSDTLESLVEQIQELGIGVSATIVNDGSANPFRLNLVGARSGRDARLNVETDGGTGLSFGRTAEARDGILFYGESTGTTESVLIRNNSNTYSDVVEGLTVTAFQTTDQPIRVNVERDTNSLIDDVGSFVESLNTVFTTIDGFTEFDLETETRGVLLGDGTLRAVERQLISALTNPLQGVGQSLDLAAEVGIRFQRGRFTFDRSQFRDALLDDPDAVETLFSAARTLESGTLIEDFNLGNGVDNDANGAEFRVTLRDGSTVDVDLAGTRSVGDVIREINDAATTAGVSLTAELASNGRSLVLRDGTTGTTEFAVTSQNGSSAANDLGLNRSADITGGGLLTGFDIELTDNPGLMAQLQDLIDGLTDTESGAVQRRADAFGSVIEELESQVTTLEERLLGREDLLRQQFAQLEQVIAESQNVQQRLTAQLGSLPTA